jgi:hypothetical protein
LRICATAAALPDTNELEEQQNTAPPLAALPLCEICERPLSFARDAWYGRGPSASAEDGQTTASPGASDRVASNEDKTHVVTLSEAFDFLGFIVRRYNGKLLIKPSKAAVRRIRERLRTELRSLRGSNAQAVMSRSLRVGGYEMDEGGGAGHRARPVKQVRPAGGAGRTVRTFLGGGCALATSMSRTCSIAVLMSAT